MPIRFTLGDVVATPAAIVALLDAGTSPLYLLVRHVTGDWGEVCAQDRAANEDALADGSRLMSVYTLNTGVTVWLITDAADDNSRRHHTTLLLPADY